MNYFFFKISTVQKHIKTKMGKTKPQKKPKNKAKQTHGLVYIY